MHSFLSKFDKQNLIGALIVFISGAFIGSYWLIKNIIVQTMSPEALNFYWFFIATFMLAAMFFIYNRKKISQEVKLIKKFKKELVLTGFFNTLASLTATYAILYLGGALGSILNQFSIFVSFILAFLFFKEMPRKTQICGAIIVIFGIALINLEAVHFSFSIGIIAGIFSAIFYSFSFLTAKRASKEASPITVNLMRVSTISLFAFIIMILTSKFVLPSASELNLFLIGALLSPVIGMALFYKGLSMMKLGYANAIKASEGIFAVIYAFIFMVGMPNQRALIGSAIVLVGVIIIAFEKKKKVALADIA